MTRYPDVMLDIETMSLHPSNALILSIGILHFDPTPDGRVQFGDRWLIKPDIVGQLLLGRHVDEKTQKFWAEQSAGAKKDWQDGDRDSLLDTCVIVANATEGAKRLWANGIVFDIGNVASLIRQSGGTEPWHYRAPRDMRTFCEELPQTRITKIDDAFEIEGVPHAALYDCEVQSHRVWEHWPVERSVPHHSV